MDAIIINNQGKMDIINIENKYDKTNICNYFKEINKNDNYQLIYFWPYNDYIIEVYGIINDNNELLNKHKLPPHGISNIIDIESENIQLYGNIYICKYLNNKLNELNISEYGELYEYYSYYLSDNDLMDESDGNSSDNDEHINNNSYNNTHDLNDLNGYVFEGNDINKKIKNIKKKIDLELELDTTIY